MISKYSIDWWLCILCVVAKLNGTQSECLKCARFVDSLTIIVRSVFFFFLSPRFLCPPVQLCE